jgi:hypothetical protein
MKKTTTYGRKLAARRAHEAGEALAALIIKDLRGLQIDAGLHAWTGQDGANMCNLAGRLCFIAAAAGSASGVDADSPDMRIVRGMAEALGDLAADLESIELHRASLQSGLAAVDRILAKCTVVNVALASRRLDELLFEGSMGTADIREAMGVAGDRVSTGVVA